MSRITAVNVELPRDVMAQLDLNLLRVFDALMRERRVARAAEALQLTQPAVSNALARLRRQLDDPLFVRSAQGLVPTARAERLGAAVNNALGVVRTALQAEPVFAPQHTPRHFRLGLSDIGEIHFLPRLVSHLRQHAPLVSLSTVRPAALDLPVAMESGVVDLAVGLLSTVPGRFRQRQLFDQGYVCLLRRGHPALGPLARRAKPRLSLTRFAALDHLEIISAGTGHGQVEQSLQRRGITRRVVLTVPHFVASGHILAATDLVATVPQRLADQLMAPFGLVAVPHPATLPRSPITMTWHERSHADPGHQWLRDTLVGLFAAAP